MEPKSSMEEKLVGGDGDVGQQQKKDKERIKTRHDFGKRWNRFRVLTPNIFILRGSRAMTDPRFKYRSRGRQAAPCSVVALVYGHLFQLKEWTCDYVDRVLEEGDKLFRMSAARCRLKDDEYMTPALVHNEVFVGMYKVLVRIEDSGIRGNLFSTKIGCSDLSDALRRFLRDEGAGVVTAQGSSVGVWRQAGDICFMCYDPAACDEAGLRQTGGTACLMRFKCVNELYEHLVKSLDRRYDSRYCIDKLEVLNITEVGREFLERLPGLFRPLLVQRKVMRAINGAVDVDEHKMDCTKPVPRMVDKVRVAAKPKIRKEPLAISISNYSIDQRFATEPLVSRNGFDETGYTYEDVQINVPTMFTELRGNTAIFLGQSHEGSDVYKGKGAQNVANCVAAIAMKKVHPVKTWTKAKMDEVLTLGDALYATVKAEKPAIKTMTAGDLHKETIQINNRKLMVDVDLITVTGTISSKVPGVLNLKQALEEFFLVNDTGVIEATAKAVAIWAEDDFYYLFEPRACDATGMRIKNAKAARGKEGPEQKNGGYACVMRFPDVNSLGRVFLKNVEPTRKNDRFTIKQVSIADYMPGSRSWHEFNPGDVGKTWVLRGSISNMDETFEENQGIQGLAMTVPALINARETSAKNWTPDTIDEMVREGNDYYNWSKPIKTEEEGAEEVEARPLFLSDLKRNLYLKNQKLTIDLEEAAIVGELVSPNGSKLERGLREFFTDRQYGIVETKKLSVAVWKTEEEMKEEAKKDAKNKNKKKEVFYYCFDANPRNELGQLPIPGEEGAEGGGAYACVVRVSDLAELAKLITKNADIVDEDEFIIHTLKNVSLGTPMTDEEIEADKEIPILPDLNNYTKMDESSALLLGTINQADEMAFKWQTRDKQQTANALVALGMTTLHNSHLWYRELIDDILKIGDKLTARNVENLPEPGPDLVRDYLLPMEITEDFVIGVNRISINLEEEMIQGSKMEVPALLEEFFELDSKGVFRQGSIIIPIWREDRLYYMMDPRGRNAQGKSDKNGAAAVMWFTDINSLAKVLQETLPADDVTIDAIVVGNAYEPRIGQARRVERTTSGENLWHHFPKVDEGVWSIEGKVPMSDERFDEANREKQSAAIAMMAIVFSKVYEPKYWKSSVLDEVIVTGDKMHAKCVERLGTETIPLVNDIFSEFFLSTRRINLTIKDCVQAGDLAGRPPKLQDLQTGIEKFFAEHDAGVLTAGDCNIAIWKFGNAVAYYAVIPDWSIERQQKLEQEEQAEEEMISTTPRVYRFRDMNGLVEYVLRHLGYKGDYEITAVDVTISDRLPPSKVDPSPAIRPGNLPPLNAYKKLQGEARAILRGGYHQADEIFPEEVRNRQGAANCVVALGMSVVKSPVTWTRKTMDEIMAIASGVHRATKKARPTKTSLKPRDIIRVFYLGVNILTADIEPDTVTGLVAIKPPDPEDEKKKDKKRPEKKKPAVRGKKVVVRERTPPPPPILLEEGLRKFFQFNRAGILVTDRGMIAIWKDLGVYFMYDPRAKNDQGLPDRYGTSCVMWFACIEPLYQMIFANIDPNEKYGPFEICRVIIKTVNLTALPCPAGFCFDRIGSKKKDLGTVEPVSEYVVIDEELSVLNGSLHMNNRIFPLMNRGLQSTAIAAVAIVVSLLHVPSTWTPKLVDAVLQYGDSLHTDSARAVRPGARNLSPCELLTVFIVGDCRATVHVHRHTTAGLLHAYDLIESLATFFRTNCAGILHTPNLAVAVMQHCGKFYLFDPCARDQYGRPAYDGTACILRSDSIARMAKLFVANYKLRHPNVYTLNAVNVLDLHFFCDTKAAACEPKCDRI